MQEREKYNHQEGTTLWVVFFGPDGSGIPRTFYGEWSGIVCVVSSPEAAEDVIEKIHKKGESPQWRWLLRSQGLELKCEPAPRLHSLEVFDEVFE
jgi:hypothetical protein